MPLNPCACVINTATVFLETELIIFLLSIDKLLKLISTNFGSKPLFITAITSEGHVSEGNNFSSFFNLSQCRNCNKFADEPEFTNTEYLTPNHFDHSYSNFSTCLF